MKNVMSYLYCLAGGVVLGALLMHMIPEITGGHEGGALSNPSKHHSCHAHSQKDHDGKGDAHGHHHHSHSHNHHCDHGHADPKVASGSQHEVLAALNPSLAYTTGLAAGMAQEGARKIGGRFSADVPQDIDHHALQSAQAGHSVHEHAYPHGPLWAGLSFLLLLAIDRLFLSHAHAKPEKKPVAGKLLDHSCSSSDTALVTDPEAAHHCSHKHDHSHAHSPAEAMASADSVDLCSGGGCQVDGIQLAQSHLSTFIFVTALSLHSFMEGLGMASKHSASDLTSFLISLFAHKWIEAFALGASVMAAGLSAWFTFAILFAYSAFTPIGILMGMFADLFVRHRFTSWLPTVEAAFNGSAVGSFMFVACVEMIPPQFGHGMPVNWHSYGRFATVIVGYSIMALVATKHSH